MAHVPQLQHLELEFTYGPHGKTTYALESFPTGFLANAPELTYLNLWPVVNLTAVAKDFLAESPQLQFLHFDANGVSVLPDSFLTRTPHLKVLDLNATSVVSLPIGFLSETPWLSQLKLDVDQVKSIPNGFLADAASLRYLDMRAEKVTEIPIGFLVLSPRLQTLGLGTPSLDAPPQPGSSLWEKLKHSSLRVKVTDPDFQVILNDSDHCHAVDWKVEPGDILEVVGREVTDESDTMLAVFPWSSRDLFFDFYERHECSFNIGAQYTEPTLDV